MSESFQIEIQNACINISLSLRDIKGFEPEKSAHQIIQLEAIPAMRNLLRDFKSNLLDSVTFCKTLEKRLKTPSLSDNLHSDLNTLAPTLKYQMKVCPQGR
ncbi:type VI secretion system contractile sheath small subunit [Klebsiella aerogenes]|uniref:Type VI secretion system contractile sheath small subunit n=1 Tax=Klebsiella aerogenes TaxID=548 RepID=A0AAP9U7U1_KLEAE|nr:type VI secretion system contractile sheath small subunit [Klebsiella aerogenes]QMR42861.1 type VI secretion system contractile sheath small subunit [Klebsiella aerogenes]